MIDDNEDGLITRGPGEQSTSGWMDAAWGGEIQLAFGQMIGDADMDMSRAFMNHRPHRLAARPIYPRLKIPTFPLSPSTHGLHPRHNQDPRSPQRGRKEQQVWWAIVEKGSSDYQKSSVGKEIGNSVRKRRRVCLDYPLGERLCGKDRWWWEPSQYLRKQVRLSHFFQHPIHTLTVNRYEMIYLWIGSMEVAIRVIPSA